jgi:hypothetical protein
VLSLNSVHGKDVHVGLLTVEGMVSRDAGREHMSSGKLPTQTSSPWLTSAQSTSPRKPGNGIRSRRTDGREKSKCWSRAGSLTCR